MKHNNKIYSIFALFATFFMMSACGDETNSFGIYSPATGGRIKFIHAAPDVAGIDIYINDKKFSGVNTAAGAIPVLLTVGGAFPSTAEYATLPAGKAKIGVVVPSLNNATGIAADLNVEEGKYYSVFATGIAPNYSPLVLEDKLPVTTGKNIYVRVINLVPNSTSAEFIVNGITIATGVGYKNTDNTFIAVPIESFLSGTINVPFNARILGGVAPVNFTASNIATIFPGRVITFIVRGVLTTDAKNPTKYAPTFSVYFNR